MIYIIIFLVLVVAVLTLALIFQIKKSNQQSEESETLLKDYQRRVDEQQALSDDYRTLEKNFDNVGAGYEHALLMYDKMEEEKQKLANANEKLEQQNHEMQEERRKTSETMLQKQEWIQKYTEDIKRELNGNPDSARRIARLATCIQNVNDVGIEVALACNDNILATDILSDAINNTGIDKSTFVKFDYMVAEDTQSTMMLTNRQQAVRVLTSLLDNAMKFTSEGNVRLTVSTEGTNIQFAVENSGTGITEEDADRIFEPFVKLNSYFDGAGVGLTVARSIARRLNGDVVLDTACASGVRFVFTLPI